MIDLLVEAAEDVGKALFDRIGASSVEEARALPWTAIVQADIDNKIALAQLKHPHVIEVYDYGLDATGPYYTMELSDGGDLSVRATLDHRAACALTIEVCSSLALCYYWRLLAAGPRSPTPPKWQQLLRRGLSGVVDALGTEHEHLLAIDEPQRP